MLPEGARMPSLISRRSMGCPRRKQSTVPLLAQIAAALNADLDITFRPHRSVAA